MTDDTTGAQVTARGARTYRIVAFLIFLALMGSAYLPAKYTMATFAIPFAAVAVAGYYMKFFDIADVQNGITTLAIVIGLLAAGRVYSSYQWNQNAKMIERYACNGAQSDWAQERCSQIRAVLHPEPTDPPEF